MARDRPVGKGQEWRINHGSKRIRSARGEPALGSMDLHVSNPCSSLRSWRFNKVLWVQATAKYKICTIKAGCASKLLNLKAGSPAWIRTMELDKIQRSEVIDSTKSLKS